MENKSMKKLKEENKELKEIVAIALNKPLLKQLSHAIKEIESGEYYTEEEFARRANLVTA
ncbi:MAG: hypothetical protein NTX24_02695 [Candidatus Pacearchaeota archaeon]|nr:hypothetical protein [Candidatus Pacearchaeota archaeon]